MPLYEVRLKAICDVFQTVRVRADDEVDARLAAIEEQRDGEWEATDPYRNRVQTWSCRKVDEE